MTQEQNGQGTLDEKIPPASSHRCCVNGEGDGYTSNIQSGGLRRELYHDGPPPIDGTARTSVSECCCDSSPSTTSITDLEKALSDNTGGTTKKTIASLNHNGTTTNAAAAKSDRMLDAVQDDQALCNEDGHFYPEGGYQAWLVVFGSFAGMTAGFGLMNTVGTFQAYVSTHQLAEESPSLVSWIFSIYIFLAFFCGVQIGPVFDAKGPKWLVLAGSVALVGGTLAFAESSSMSRTILFLSLL